ncbi:MAG: hypothetical protein ACRCWR_03605 [Saezia sp.]
MTISEFVDVDFYTQEVLKIERDPWMWDSFTHTHKHTISHRIPRTCADCAGVGHDGVQIRLRAIPCDRIEDIKLGAHEGKEQALKMRNGLMSINNFSGYFRRMSAKTQEIFSQLIT